MHITLKLGEQNPVYNECLNLDFFSIYSSLRRGPFLIKLPLQILFSQAPMSIHLVAPQALAVCEYCIAQLARECLHNIFSGTPQHFIVTCATTTATYWLLEWILIRSAIRRLWNPASSSWAIWCACSTKRWSPDLTKKTKWSEKSQNAV